MLDFMRKYADKIIWVIIIAFVLSLGILSFSRPNRGDNNSSGPRNPADIAYVNGKPIDQNLFMRLYNIGLMNVYDPRQQDAPDPKTLTQVGYLALQQTLDMEKRLDYARRLKIKASNREVKQQVEAIKNTYQITDNADFERLLAANGMNSKTFQREIRNEIILNKLEENIRQSVSVTTKDVQNQYKKVHARHILIAFQRAGTEDKTDKERVRLAGDLAADVYDQLLDGADFAELAKTYSDDTGSAVQGGDLGFFGVNVMVPEFEEVAFNLEPGEISKPFQTQFGYHIVKVEEVDQQPIPLDVDEAELQQQLLRQKQDAAMQQFYNKLQMEYTTEIVHPEFLAFDYRINGDYDQALMLYRNMSSQNPQSPIPQIFTAELYELLNQNTEALAEYERALLIQKLNPATQNPFVHFYFANYYAKQKQNAKALEQLDLAESLVSDNLTILGRIKDKYTELNATARANRTALKISAVENAFAAMSATANAGADDVQFVD